MPHGDTGYTHQHGCQGDFALDHSHRVDVFPTLGLVVAEGKLYLAITPSHDGSRDLLLEATRGVAITVVSSLERKWR